jgi:DNA-binding NarL/FixJ family response regulator
MSTDPANYQRRAEIHKPKTASELRSAIQRMLSEGMSEHGIADILSLNVEAVRRLAGCRDCE